MKPAAPCAVASLGWSNIVLTPPLSIVFTAAPFAGAEASKKGLLSSTLKPSANSAGAPTLSAALTAFLSAADFSSVSVSTSKPSIRSIILGSAAALTSGAFSTTGAASGTGTISLSSVPSSGEVSTQQSPFAGFACASIIRLAFPVFTTLPSLKRSVTIFLAAVLSALSIKRLTATVSAGTVST